jgi:hypothetical protein
VPATRRAVTARSDCDLFPLHSKREIAEFSEIGTRRAPRLRFGLASLPYLPARTPEPVADAELACSSCLGTLDDLRSGRFFQPDPRWLEDNYFHHAAEND